MDRRALLILLWGLGTGPLSAQRAPASAPLDSLIRWAQRDSLDARAQFDLGMGRWNRRQYDLADSAFRRALVLMPHYAQPRLALAILPLTRGDRYLRDLYTHHGEDTVVALIESSAKFYREAYLIDPMVDPTIIRSVDIDELIPRVNKLEVANGKVFSRGVPWWEGHTKQGVKYLIEGNYPEAFASLESVINARQVQEGAFLPDQVVWYYALAAAHAGKYDRAAAAFHELADRAAAVF